MVKPICDMDVDMQENVDKAVARIAQLRGAKARREFTKVMVSINQCDHYKTFVPKDVLHQLLLQIMRKFILKLTTGLMFKHVLAICWCMIYVKALWDTCIIIWDPGGTSSRTARH